jgi:NAD(P)-dependent dehydrogenase (short-subunit alcohol dehydrogenase family)
MSNATSQRGLTLPTNPETSRTVIITGANTGLGYACAHALLASKQGLPWHVVLACRNEERAQAAEARLTETAGARGRVEAMSLDLASLESVRSFAAEFADRVRFGALSPVRGLVCNAGVQSGATRSVTADGFEATFGINHLGHFLLVNLLLGVLEPPARVVVVSSVVHDPAKKAGLPDPAWNDPAALARGDLGPAAAADKPLAAARRRYATSKLANVYFTYALAHRLPDGITVNAFDPGLMPGTGLVRGAPAAMRFANAHIGPRIVPLLRHIHNPNVHTVTESADALTRLIIDPSLADITGKYFEGRREIRSSDESYDEARAEELWHASEALTALA